MNGATGSERPRRFSVQELPPTPRQIEMLRIIDRLANERGYPPSIREVGKAAGITSTNGVRDALHWLRLKGLVSSRELTARSLLITELGKTYLTGGGT